MAADDMWSLAATSLHMYIRTMQEQSNTRAQLQVYAARPAALADAKHAIASKLCLVGCKKGHKQPTCRLCAEPAAFRLPLHETLPCPWTRSFIKNNLLVEITSDRRLAQLFALAIRRHTIISYSLYIAGERLAAAVSGTGTGTGTVWCMRQ